MESEREGKAIDVETVLMFGSDLPGEKLGLIQRGSIRISPFTSKLIGNWQTLTA